MRRLSMLVSLVAIAALAGTPSANAATCTGGDVRPALDNIAQIAETTLCLINDQRATAGLAPVTEQAQLTKASAAYSGLMVKEQFFAHVSPEGSELTDRLTDVGYLGHPGSWMVGENIAWGESYLATPAEIVKAWMNSPPHRANILNGDYEEIGLGIAVGTPSTPNPGATYTTDFGRRRTDDPPATTAKGEITVGDVAPAPDTAAHGTRGANTLSPAHSVRRAPSRHQTGRCRSGIRRARAARRGTTRVRCAGAWRAVRKHI